MKFSERMGYSKPRTVLQTETMDADLRNRLWTTFYSYFLNYDDDTGGRLYGLAWNLWTEHLKQRGDDFSNDKWDRIEDFKEWFFSAKPWEVYDLLEWVVQNSEEVDQIRDEFVATCNHVLTEEMSAFRFVGFELAPLTSDEEIASVEAALQFSGVLRPVSLHIEEALRKLAQKTADYRNSIKESISAVESAAKLISGETKAELAHALKTLENGGVKIHRAQRDGFAKLYGYTSDASGIRHALLDEPNLDESDARYMLVSCSAFVNYVVSKAAEAGLIA